MTVLRLYEIVCDGCDEASPIEPAYSFREAALDARRAGWYVCLRGNEKRGTRRGDALCPDCDIEPPR